MSRPSEYKVIARRDVFLRSLAILLGTIVALFLSSFLKLSEIKFWNKSAEKIFEKTNSNTNETTTQILTVNDFSLPKFIPSKMVEGNLVQLSV